MGEGGHLFGQIRALALRADRLITTHDQCLKLMAARAADKIE